MMAKNDTNGTRKQKKEEKTLFSILSFNNRKQKYGDNNNNEIRNI